MLMVVFTLFFGRVGGSRRPGVPYRCSRSLRSCPGRSSPRASSARQQPGRSRRTYPEGLLPEAPAAGGRGRVVPRRLRDRDARARPDDGVLRRAAPTLQVLWLLPLVVLAVVTALARRDLALRGQRPVPRRSVRRALPGPGVAVRLAGRLLGRASCPRSGNWLYQLNPMAGVIEGFRWALLGAPYRPGRHPDLVGRGHWPSSSSPGLPTSAASSAPSRT